ncbi:Uncharacterized protein DBV15_10647, partial [Temnothorax longispinosus]
SLGAILLKAFPPQPHIPVRRQMDNRVGSCKWHLKIAHGYERDSRVVPTLRGDLAQPSAQMRRGLRGQPELQILHLIIFRHKDLLTLIAYTNIKPSE